MKRRRALASGTIRGPFRVLADTTRRVGRHAVLLVECTRCGTAHERSSDTLGKAAKRAARGCSACVDGRWTF
jgi:ribosomal protein L44E